MSRIIITSRYLKSGSSNKLKKYVKYIATRETVEKREQNIVQNKAPASEKQQELLSSLLNDFPEAKMYLEYEDYIQNQSSENISELVSAIIERNVDTIGGRENFVGYMAMRPGVEKRGMHGLFNSDDEPIVLDKVADEVANHKGNVWSHVVSLHRADAIRLGYDNSDAWRELVKRHISEIAEQTKIPMCNLKWYAAFHDTTHHPHIHLIVYSKNPKQGYLTKDGIDKIRSAFANDIFHDDLQSIYQEQTLSRDELKAESKKYVEDIIKQISQNEFHNDNLENLITKLYSQLKNCAGKKVYGYLSSEVKETVNAIFSELSKDKNIEALYEKWCELESQKYKTYTQKEKVFPPLNENKAFHSVRNIIIQQILNINSVTNDLEIMEQSILDNDDMSIFGADIDSEMLDTFNSEKIYSDNHSSVYIDWSDEYKSASKLLYEKDKSQQDFQKAYSILKSESDKGNVLATADIGKMYAQNMLGEENKDISAQYFEKVFTGFLFLEPGAKKVQPYIQYRLGKMYSYGQGAEQDYVQAFNWFSKSANAGNQYAQFSLGSLYYYGNGVEKGLGKAVYWYEKSADQGNAYAHYSLARMYHYGEFVEKDMDKAQHYYKTAFNKFERIELQDDNLWYRLGSMCKNGLGTEKDVARAINYFKASADLENKNAMCEYASELIKGENVPQDVEQGISMLQKSLKLGNLNAAYVLGKLYMDGKYVYSDFSLAEKYLLLSAEKNDFAQYRLGKLYLKDEFYNLQKAIEWLEKASVNDNQYAKYALAKILISDEQYKDVDRAIILLKQTADTNSCSSYLLGKLFLFSQDVPKDKEQAVQWLSLSAGQGNEYAQNLLDHMNDFDNAMLANTVMSLFVNLSRCIGNDYNQKFQSNKLSVDRKLRRVIQEKKMAMGVKYTIYI